MINPKNYCTTFGKFNMCFFIIIIHKVLLTLQEKMLKRKIVSNFATKSKLERVHATTFKNNYYFSPEY